MAQAPDGEAKFERPWWDKAMRAALPIMSFLTSLIFIAFWTWFSVRTIRAGEYAWAMGSLSLFVVFLLARTVIPRGRASSYEISLGAWAKLRAEFQDEAEKQAEAVFEKIEERIERVAPQAKPALENAKPALVRETARAFERAAVEGALLSSSVSNITHPFSTTVEADLFFHVLTEEPSDEAMMAAVRRRLKRFKGMPTDPSSASAPRLGD